MKITIEIPDNEITEIQKNITHHLRISKLTVQIVGNALTKELIVKHEITDKILTLVKESIERNV